jgi:hypothetical protein
LYERGKEFAMSDKKIIAVVGATGAQGGGLVRTILNEANSGFVARALTRKVDSDKAKELAKLGAEVVAADLDDVESLKRAFAGAYGAFLLTNFGSTFRRKKSWLRRKTWPKPRNRRISSMSSGRRSKTRGNGYRSAITGCRP